MRLGLARDVLEPVLAGEAPMTASLAIDLEEAGNGNAALWMRIQGTYALAQERLRREREAASRTSIAQPEPDPEPSATDTL